MRDLPRTACATEPVPVPIASRGNEKLGVRRESWMLPGRREKTEQSARHYRDSPGRGTIERIAIEKWRIINKVELHPGMLAAADYRTEPVAVVERHGDAAHHSLWVLKLSLTIQGKIDAYLMTSGNQGLG